MNTLRAFLVGQLNRGKEQKVFDWDRAAQIIVERGATEASAGLSGDWEWTGGQILQDGQPIPQNDTYTFLASTWATPELDINGEIIPCFKMRSEVPDWNAKTYWPESALAILKTTGE